MEKILKRYLEYDETYVLECISDKNFKFTSLINEDVTLLIDITDKFKELKKDFEELNFIISYLKKSDNFLDLQIEDNTFLLSLELQEKSILTLYVNFQKELMDFHFFDYENDDFYTELFIDINNNHMKLFHEFFSFILNSNINEKRLKILLDENYKKHLLSIFDKTIIWKFGD